MRRIFPLVVFLLLLALPAWALGQTRALLVACRDFLTLPDLGNSVSGNLHIVGSALVGAGLNLGSLLAAYGMTAPAAPQVQPQSAAQQPAAQPVQQPAAASGAIPAFPGSAAPNGPFANLKR